MAHDYGVLWMENLGGGNWRKHIIDDTWSQAYAMTMVDLNRDGDVASIVSEAGISISGLIEFFSRNTDGDTHWVMERRLRLTDLRRSPSRRDW